MDVFAFLNYADGTVYAECQAEHTTMTCLEVFERHLFNHSPTESLHYVMDNLSTHCGYPFCQMVARHSGDGMPSRKRTQGPGKATSMATVGGKTDRHSFPPLPWLLAQSRGGLVWHHGWQALRGILLFPRTAENVIRCIPDRMEYAACPPFSLVI